MNFKSDCKKYFLSVIFLSVIFSNVVSAQDSTTVETTQQSKSPVSLELAKERIGHFLQLLENTRLHYADYFLKLRDEKKKLFSTIEIADLDKGSGGSDIAGVDSDNVKMPNTTELKEHFADYALYFLASSLHSFFNNKVIFYTGLILFVFLSLRFILRRFM